MPNVILARGESPRECGRGIMRTATDVARRELVARTICNRGRFHTRETLTQRFDSHRYPWPLVRASAPGDSPRG